MGAVACGACVLMMPGGSGRAGGRTCCWCMRARWARVSQGVAGQHPQLRRLKHRPAASTAPAQLPCSALDICSRYAGQQGGAGREDRLRMPSPDSALHRPAGGSCGRGSAVVLTWLLILCRLYTLPLPQEQHWLRAGIKLAGGTPLHGSPEWSPARRVGALHCCWRFCTGRTVGHIFFTAGLPFCARGCSGEPQRKRLLSRIVPTPPRLAGCDSRKCAAAAARSSDTTVSILR